MKERRQSERFSTHLSVHWEMAGGILQGIAINGSAGGCFVLAQVEEPSDEPMHLAIQLPNGKQLQLQGEVTYYLPTKGFGLQFHCPTDEDQGMLKLWLDYLRTLKG